MRVRLRRAEDEGIGLAEMIVAMIILTILLLSMLSVIISALRITVGNTTKATATQLVTERIEEARQEASTGSCANVRAIVESVENTTDARGVPLKVSGSLVCAAQTLGDEHAQPRLARVTVTVTTTKPGLPTTLATTSTDIYVKFNAP